MDGLGGGLLAGVEVLNGEGWLPSVSSEVLESSAKIPNLLLHFILVQASLLSSETIALSDPEIFKSGL